jgi:GNAT superfamily N-acetyltransferase
MEITIKRLDSSLENDFWSLHNESNGCGECFCAAWHTDDWVSWDKRSPADNRELREGLFKRQVHDGYLLYKSGQVVGWCQCDLRDTFVKLCRQYERPGEAKVWSINCLLLLEEYRGQHLALEFVRLILADLQTRGALAVETFPRCGDELEDEDAWTGPEGLYRQLGFRTIVEDSLHPVMRINIPTGEK